MSMTTSWRGRSVLVTGAGGFIGSHLAERLVREGARVRAMVHYNALGRRGWLDTSPHSPDMEMVAGDIGDRDSVRRAVKGVDTVFHLAALIGIPYSYQAPVSYVRTNIEGTMHVMQACLEEGTRRAVLTSTSEVYGTARYVPIDEQHPLQGQSPYSASKIAADKMAEAFHCSFALPMVIARPFNTFGPRQSMRAVIPTIIAQCLKGETVKLGNVTPTRDMNYVANTVDGFLAAAAAPGVEGQVINLGSGREVGIGELARMIAEIAGGEIAIEAESERIRPPRSEVERLLAANEKARDLLDWTPRVSLEDGLAQTVQWLREHANLYRSDEYAV